MKQDTAIVELENITKRFPGVLALDNVSMTLRKGSVHGLLGENGAGKSTLMKILSGAYTSYEGKILLDGKKISFSSEKDALRSGISIVPQELHPVPEFTIAENIFLGREPEVIKGFVSYKQREILTRKHLTSLGLDYDPNIKMKYLSVAQKQMVEIVKAISRNSHVIIMDEPTSALNDMETEFLFQQIDHLKKEGIAVVFISHKLEEVYRVCDDYTVLRDGKFIGTGNLCDINTNQLIQMMVGREVIEIFPTLPSHSDEVVFQARHLTRESVFSNISFDLHKGEILGLAGMFMLRKDLCEERRLNP